MKRRTKWVFGIAAVVVIGATVSAVAVNGRTGGDASLDALTGHRGDVVDEALAVGTIEPEVVVSVKSMLSGVVRRRFAEVGEYVEAGAPLLEIQPTPTPIELAEARRNVELRANELAHLEREIERQRQLEEQGVVSSQELEDTQRRHSAAALEAEMAGDRLALLEQGRITIAQQEIETTVLAPVSGYILEREIEVGDQVVPLSSYQDGTVLMTMADMGTLVFRGTVDEIDVGRLEEGMDADIRIGALPQAEIEGVLTRIALQSVEEENATVFPIEITLTQTDGMVLRAGYSANAHVLIDRREDVLLIPERVVSFSGDTAWVDVLQPDGRTERRQIETGLSDAINVEVVSGLEEDEQVVGATADADDA